MVRRKTGTILKRGQRFYIYYTINGKRHAKVTDALNKTEAQQILNKYLPKEIDYSQRGNIKFKDYSESWLERRKISLKPSVFDRYQLNLIKHILPFFGELKLNNIYAGNVQDFVLHLSKKTGRGDKPLSPKTVNNILLVLNQIMIDAVDDKRIETNPVIYRKHKRRYNYPEKDHFSVEEMNLFLQNVNPNYLTFFLMAWHTGLRLGELIGLKWEDIDWSKKAITVRRSIYQKGKQNIVTQPKTKSGNRTIFMTPILNEAMKNYKEKKKVETIEGYVFEKDGKPFNKDGIVRSQFRQALRKAGLRKTLTPHSIRHGLITVMRANFPEHIVKRMAGHSLGNNVTEVYTHVTDAEMQRYAVELEKLLLQNNKRALML